MWKQLVKTGFIFLACFLAACGIKHGANAATYYHIPYSAKPFTVDKFATYHPVPGMADSTVDQSLNLDANRPIIFRINLKCSFVSNVNVRIVIQSQDGRIKIDQPWGVTIIDRPQTMSFVTTPDCISGLPIGAYAVKVYADLKPGDNNLVGTYTLLLSDRNVRPKAEVIVDAFMLASKLDKSELEPINPGTSFVKRSTFFFYAKLSYAHASYEKVRVDIRQNGRLVDSLPWKGEALSGNEVITRIYTVKVDDCGCLEPGSYVAELLVSTSPADQDAIVLARQPFTITKTKPAPEPARAAPDPPPNVEDQIAKIADLKKSLSEKIAEAEKHRDYFSGQEKAIQEQLAKGGLPDKKVQRLNRDLKRKHSYFTLINTYWNELSGRLDTLEEIEDDFKDRNRWRNLIDDAFVKRVSQTIKEVNALLNDTPLTKAQPAPKPKRRKR